MLYKKIEVLEINPVVHLKEKATKNWKENEKYVLNKMVKFDFNNFGIENPVNDIVYIYFKDKVWSIETEELCKIYEKLSKIFDEVKINLYLDDSLEGVGNSIDLTLDEFLNIPKMDGWCKKFESECQDVKKEVDEYILYYEGCTEGCEGKLNCDTCSNCEEEA